MLTFSLIITLLSMTVQERSIVDERLIEDMVPAELEKRRDVADLILRLAVLRRNQSIFGEKHPQFQKIQVDIKSLEDQLSAILNAGKSPPSIAGAKKSEALPRKDSPATSESVTEKPIERKLALGLKERPVWKNLNLPLLKRETPYQLHPLPPSGYLDSFSQVGAFPALGMLWGLQLEPRTNAQLWIGWKQSDPTKSRTLLWKSPTPITSLVLDREFETTGRIYLTRVAPKTEAESELLRLEIMVAKSELEPPFHLLESPTLLATVEGDNECRILAGSNGTIFFAGKHNGIIVLKQNFESKKIANGLSAFRQVDSRNAASDGESGAPDESIFHPQEVLAADRLFYDHVGMVLWNLEISEGKVRAIPITGKLSDKKTIEWKTDGTRNLWSPWMLGNEGLANDPSTFVAIDKVNGEIVRLNLANPNHGIVPVCRTTVSLRSLTLDSNEEPMVQDESGQVYHLRNAPPTASIDLPLQLSKSGLYVDTEKGTVGEGFVSYSTKSSLASPDACMVDSRENSIGVFKIDQWIGVPSGSTAFTKTEQSIFPDQTVFLQTFTDAKTLMRDETRILIHQGREWYGFIYKWNESQSDAILARAEGEPLIPNRGSCSHCHLKPNNQFILGFRPSNLTEYHRYKPNESALQIRTLRQIGILP
jgi:hypothetical protein